MQVVLGRVSVYPWGYCAVSSGNITDEMIMAYIQNQDEDEEKRGDNFTVINT